MIICLHKSATLISFASDVSRGIKSTTDLTIQINIMNYYYLDGLEKKGPYSKEELKASNLTPNTLVFSNGMKNWTMIKELTELDSFLFKVVAKQSGITSESNPAIIDNNISNESTTKNRIKIKQIKLSPVYFIIAGIVFSILIACGIVSVQRYFSEVEINKTIDNFFRGKNAVCDFTDYPFTVNLYPVEKKMEYLFIKPNGDVDIKPRNVVRVKNKELAAEPSVQEFVGGQESEEYQRQKSIWADFKDLVDYYKLISGGFQIMKISKKYRGFDVVTINPCNMGFKVPKSNSVVDKGLAEQFAPTDFTRNERGTVEEAYDETKLQLTVLNPDKSYRRGAYDSILLFRTSSIGTEFFRISVTSISDLNSINNSYTLSNGKYIVWIKEKGSHIYILETEGVFNKKWAIYSLIGSVISTLIYFFIRYRKKIVFNFS